MRTPRFPRKTQARASISKAEQASSRGRCQMSRETRSREAKPRETTRPGPCRGGAFHRAGSAAAFTATDVAAETGAGERLPIAVSGRNFNTVFEKARSRNPRPAWLHKYFHSEYVLEQTAFPFLKRNRGQTSTSAP